MDKPYTPKGYCDKEDLEAYLGVTISSPSDAEIDNWIREIERFIEEKTGRCFVADTAASEKIYDGNGKTEIYIDENIELTSVKLYDCDGDLEYTLVENEDFVTWPYNELPIIRLDVECNPNQGVYYFPCYQKGVRVTAKWGYSEHVPEDLRFATTVLVAGIYNSYNGDGSSVKANFRTGRYTVQYRDPKQAKDYVNAMSIIEQYTKYEA